MTTWNMEKLVKEIWDQIREFASFPAFWQGFLGREYDNHWKEDRISSNHFVWHNLNLHFFIVKLHPCASKGMSFALRAIGQLHLALMRKLLGKYFPRKIFVPQQKPNLITQGRQVL